MIKLLKFYPKTQNLSLFHEIWSKNDKKWSKSLKFISKMVKNDQNSCFLWFLYVIKCWFFWFKKWPKNGQKSDKNVHRFFNFSFFTFFSHVPLTFLQGLLRFPYFCFKFVPLAKIGLGDFFTLCVQKKKHEIFEKK